MNHRSFSFSTMPPLTFLYFISNLFLFFSYLFIFPYDGCLHGQCVEMNVANSQHAQPKLKLSYNLPHLACHRFLSLGDLWLTTKHGGWSKTLSSKEKISHVTLERMVNTQS